MAQPASTTPSTLTSPPESMPPLVPEVSSALPRIVQASLGQWVQGAQGILRQVQRPVAMVEASHHIILAANKAIEDVIKNSNASFSDSKQFLFGENYYRRPIIAVSPASDVNVEKSGMFRVSRPLEDVFSDALGLGITAQLVVPQSRDDVERIGSSHDFLSMLFWAQVRALYESQKPWNPRTRYDEMLQGLSDADTKLQLARLRDSRGAYIHSIRAKDTTGWWAYYFVHVPEKKEQQFLSHIETDGEADLEIHGRIILSGYEESFRERQSQVIRDRLGHLAERYTRLAQRERAYSYAADTHTLQQPSAFEKRWFISMVANADARKELVEQLARAAHGHGEPFHADIVPDAALAASVFRYRLLPEPAQAILGVMQRRKLPLSFLHRFAQMIAMDNTNLRPTLDALRLASRRVGTDAASFAEFFYLVCQNENLTAAEQLSTALKLTVNRHHAPLARFAPSTALLAGLIFSPLALLAVPAIVVGTSHLMEGLRNAIATLDALMRLHPPLAPEFLESVQRFCIAPDAGCDAALAEAQTAMSHILEQTREKKPIFEGEDAVAAAGVRIEHNLLYRLAQVSIETSSSPEEEKIGWHLFQSAFILELRAISILGEYIESREYSEKRAILKGLLEQPLQEAFAATDFPEEKRAAYVERVLDTLLSHDLAQQEQAPAATAKETVPDLRATLPKEAPATWKHDKQPGDTPPDFIKRHYGQWLREDASGLTLPDIRRLDSSLYMALRHWQKSNALPVDCPLPSKKEIIAMETQGVRESIDEGAIRSFWRMKAREKRAQPSNSK